MATDDDEPRAKDLLTRKEAVEELDPETKAQLERWFGLPSFQELEERGEAPEEDPYIKQRRESKAAAASATDPILTEALYARGAKFSRASTLRVFDPTRVAEVEIQIDASWFEGLSGRTETRQYPIAQWLAGAMGEPTPQAVLRDLHRPESYFERQFYVDPSSGVPRVDARAAVKEVLASRPPAAEVIGQPLPLTVARAKIAEMEHAKRAPWSEIRTPNRRVQE